MITVNYTQVEKARSCVALSRSEVGGWGGTDPLYTTSRCSTTYIYRIYGLVEHLIPDYIPEFVFVLTFYWGVIEIRHFIKIRQVTLKVFRGVEIFHFNLNLHTRSLCGLCFVHGGVVMPKQCV